MGSTKIDVEAFVKSSLIEQAEMDTIFHSVDVNDKANHKLLEVPSFYLSALKHFQRRYMSVHNISCDNYSLEHQMLRLFWDNAYEEVRDYEEKFVRLFFLADENDDLIYDSDLRPILIELGLVSILEPNESQPRPEFVALQKALEVNDLSAMYKHSRQIHRSDLENLTEGEKKIVLKVLKVDSYGVFIALVNSLLDVGQIHQGTWKEYWYSLSNYKPGDPLEKNYFLWGKAFCIDSDQIEDPIDMSMFPNLPSIYDAAGEFDLALFANSIDWSNKFEPHEVEFIVAASMTLDQDRDRIFLDWELEDEYVKIRSQLHQKIDSYIVAHNIALEDK